MIGIMCAMEREIQTMQEKITDAKTERISGYDFTVGQLCGKEVVLCRCGIGKVNAALCTEAMLVRYPVDLVINSGVAGSLRAPVEIGDIVVATDLVQHDVDTSALGDPIGFVSTVNTLSFPCDEAAASVMAEAAGEIEGINVYRMRIASGDQFITAKADKDRIVELFDAVACEMEGGAIAQVCYANQVKCLVIRAISDSSSGQHHMEYSEFMPMAAEHSANAVMSFLQKY